jgi:hypothetical protein
LAAFAFDAIIHIDRFCPVRQAGNEPMDGFANRLIHPSSFRLAAGGPFSDPRIDHNLLQLQALGMDQEQKQKVSLEGRCFKRTIEYSEFVVVVQFAI